MQRLRRYPSMVRLLATMLLVVPLSACTHWVPLSDPSYIADSPHSMFRLTVSLERSKVIVKNPKIEGDSLVWDKHGRQTLPMSRVKYAEAHQIDPVATGFLGIATAAFITAFILVNESGTSIGL